MIPSLEGWPTKAKEAPSPHEVRLTQLDTNPVFLCLEVLLISAFSWCLHFYMLVTFSWYFAFWWVVFDVCIFRFLIFGILFYWSVLFMICLFKACLHYKRITSENVSSEAQVKNVFISEKSYVPFSRYESIFVFNHPMIYQICDVMSIITWGRVNFLIYLLNHNSLSHQTWPIDRYKQEQ